MYYRVAIQGNPSLPWQWKSTPLSSLNTVLQWLQFYRAWPKERLRIFSAPSREQMNEQLARENQGRGSASVPAAQFLRERMIGAQGAGWVASEADTAGQEPRASIAVALASTSNESRWGMPALVERGNSFLEKRRVELEGGAGGDHDIPYRFALPLSLPQVLAWTRLLGRVQRGEWHHEARLREEQHQSHKDGI